MISTSVLSFVRYMSKSKKTPAQKTLEKSTGPIFLDKNGNIVVQVLAKPGAKSNGITGIEEEGVGIQINARPIDGEANSELVKYITSVLELKKNEICFDRGMKSRQKVLIITRKDFTPEKVLEKLKEQIKDINKTEKQKGNNHVDLSDTMEPDQKTGFDVLALTVTLMHESLTEV